MWTTYEGEYREMNFGQFFACLGPECESDRWFWYVRDDDADPFTLDAVKSGNASCKEWAMSYAVEALMGMLSGHQAMELRRILQNSEPGEL